MKRYLLFAGKIHEPNGGWCAFQGGFDSIEEAKDVLLKKLLGGVTLEWYHIVDIEIQEIVAKDWSNDKPY